MPLSGVFFVSLHHQSNRMTMFKKTDPNPQSEVTNKRIKWIENNLNNRPRKRLGYLTPNEKFKQIINMNSVAFGT